MASTERRMPKRVYALMWWKEIILLGLVFQPSSVVGLFEHGQSLSNGSIGDVGKTLQPWNVSDFLFCKWDGATCNTLNQITGLISGLIRADALVREYLPRQNISSGNANVRYWTDLSLISCLTFPKGSTPESCSPRRVLQQDADDPNEPDVPFDPFHPWPRGPPPPKSPSTPPYNLTGIIPRKDPLKSFRIYRGGFNVTNIHYWSSASYTGFWGYVLAFFCMLSSISCSILFCWGCIGKPNGERLKQHAVASSSSRLYPLIGIFLFSLVALAAAVVIYWGNSRLEKQLRVTAGTLLSAADSVQLEINHALQLVQLATMLPISRQGSSHQFLQACFTLGRVFNRLEKKVKHNKDKVYRIFGTVKAALTIVSAALAVVVGLGAVGTLGSWRSVLIGTFVLMTLLLFASWLLAGVSFALTKADVDIISTNPLCAETVACMVNSVADDACMIMGEYERNPMNSSISRALPCLSNPVASKALGGAKAAIKSLVTQANVAIDWANREEGRIAHRKNSTIDFHLPHVCDPYGPAPSFIDSVCPPDETAFANFGTVYGPFRCISDNISYCFEQATPVPNVVFLQASMAMNASSIVYKMLPSIFRIITCNFVRVTFENILWNHCAPLRKSLNELWAGFMIASLALMPLQVCLLLLIRSKRLDRQIFILRRLRFPDNRVRNFSSPLGGIRGQGTSPAVSRPGTPSTG